MLWRGPRVIVELDGHDAHDSRAQIERDRRRELRLRAAGFVVLRYTWDQVTREPGLVVTDVRLALARAPSH
jgi:very-short-patch-repair endonuclease